MQARYSPGISIVCFVLSGVEQPPLHACVGSTELRPQETVQAPDHERFWAPHREPKSFNIIDWAKAGLTPGVSLGVINVSADLAKRQLFRLGLSRGNFARRGQHRHWIGAKSPQQSCF
jgi:hypothetical protein